MSIQFLNGDCLEVMKELPGNSVDCFICDLPYGCLASCEGKWDRSLDLALFWTQIRRLAKSDHTPVLMFCTTKFGYELIKSNESWFRYELVWDKVRGVSFLTANKMPMRSHEMIYVFSKAGTYYNRVDIIGDFKKGGGGRSKAKFNPGINTLDYNNPTQAGKRCAKSIITCGKLLTKDCHPTEKPIELYKWLIERYCPVGGTIVDPTAGSFNSCFAGYALGRHCIGIEKDETFYRRACDRADSLE